MDEQFYFKLSVKTRAAIWEDSNFYDELVGWIEGINRVNQKKNYYSFNMIEHTKYCSMSRYNALTDVKVTKLNYVRYYIRYHYCSLDSVYGEDTYDAELEELQKYDSNKPGGKFKPTEEISSEDEASSCEDEGW